MLHCELKDMSNWSRCLVLH